MIGRHYQAKLWQLNMLFVGIVLAMIFAVSAHVYAIYGRGWYEGYFNGATESTSASAHGQVILNGVPLSAQTSKAGFISFVQGKLSSGGRDAIGAAFIIQTMRQQNGSPGLRPPSGAEIADWQSRINSSSVSMSVGAYSHPYNSAYGKNINDDIFYPEAGSATGVIFRVSGVIAFVVKLDCANVIGGIGLPPGGNWSLVGTSAAGPNVQPGQTATFTHSIRNSGTVTAPGNSWGYVVFAMPPTPGIGGETARTGYTRWGGALAPGATAVITNSYPIPGNATPGQQYCERIGYDPVDDRSPATRNGRSNTACVTVIGWSLSGTSTVAPTAVRPGTPVTFSHTIHNTGNMATGTWNWQLNWSTPAGAITGAVTSGGGCSPTSGSVSGLAPGANNGPHNCNFSVPAGAADGAQYCMLISYTPANNQVPPLVNQHSAPACVTVHAQIAVTCSLAMANLTNPGSPLEETNNIRGTMTVAQTAATSAFPMAPPQMLQYTVTGPSGFSASGTATGATAVSSFASVFNVINAAAGQYSVLVRFTSGPAGGLDSVPLTTFNPCGTFTVARLPYLRTYTGDVQAGAHFRNAAGSCPSSASTAQLQAFNRGASASGAGSGAQVAAFSGGTPNGFVSSSIRAPASLKLLTFANTSGTYGTGYGYGPCIPDYWNPVTTGQTTAIGALTTPGNDVNSKIAGGGTNFSGRQDIFVNGDAYISGSITYSGAGGSWTVTPTNNIPYFRLIVKGNIYIAPGVTQLDGVYVAIPTSANDGLIYTCATNSGAGIDANFVANSCASKLTVNGAFVAQDVKFTRTSGTLASANAAIDATPVGSKAAEVFVYSPELWMGTPQFVTPPSLQTYDAITSLPPVL